MKEICSAEGCPDSLYCKGFCKRHYSQYQKHGKILPELPSCPSLPGEEWKGIKGWERLYQISNKGRVKALNYGRRHAPQIKSLRKDKNGYLIVDLANKQLKKTISVHRLVCEAFHPNPDRKRDVNHINGVKDDNRSENLEWVSHLENCRHSRKVLGKGGRPSVAVRCVETGKVYPNMHAAAHDIGRTTSNIKMVVDGVYQTTGGFHWEKA